MTNSKMKLKNSVYNSIKKIKCLGINLVNEVQDFYIENYKTYLKEIKDINK